MKTVWDQPFKKGKGDRAMKEFMKYTDKKFGKQKDSKKH
jgi:hypothetical protein